MPEQTDPLSIEVDRELCMGSGICVMYAPNTFVHDEETKATVVDARGDPIENIRISVEACPTGALRIVYERTENS